MFAYGWKFLKSLKWVSLGLLMLIFSGASGMIVQAQRPTVWIVCPTGCQFSQIQAAIDAARAGDYILMGPGTYTENLSITKSLTIQGTKRELTIIQSADPKKPVIAITSGEQIEVLLEKLTATGAMDSDGLDVADSAAVHLINSQISGNSRGVYVLKSARVDLTNCEISGNTYTGLDIADSAIVSVIDSKVSGNGSVGIFAVSNAQAHLTNTQVSDNAQGLHVSGLAKMSLTNSYVSGNKGIGLFVDDSVQVALTKSQVSANRGDGLFVRGLATVTITNSQVSNNKLFGLEVTGSALVTLDSSQLSSNEGAGLYVGDLRPSQGSPKVSLTNVQVSASADGVFVQSSAQVEIKESSVSNNKRCGIWGYGNGAQITGGPNEMRGNGVDLCGSVPAELRRPLVPQTTRRQLAVPRDFTNLQEAVDAVASGGTILLQAGSYDAELTLWKPMTIQGVGKDETTLKAPQAGQVIVSIIAEAQGVTLKGLTVTGAQGRLSSAAMLIYGEVALQDVQISNNESIGIDAYGRARVGLSRSVVSSNGWYGLEIWDVAQVQLTDSIVKGNDLRVMRMAEMDCRDSQFTNSEIQVADLATASFTNCQITRGGLKSAGKAQVSLTNSQISDNPHYGLDAMDSSTVVIQSSRIVDNGADTTLCSHPDYSFCNGIFLSDQAAITVTDSLIMGNADWGIEALLRECGPDPYLGGQYARRFTGKIVFQGTNRIEGNNKSGKENGKGNPGNHPFKDLPDGQVCLP